MLLSACIVGAIIGAAIVWMLYNCCCHTSCGQKRCVLSPDSTGVKHINVTAANTLFKAYLALPHGVDTVKAFSINLKQFNAMKLILQHDSTVLAFRVYFGMDSLVPVRMVVGFGSPEREDYIYETPAENCGLCPVICDAASPIMAK